jgi:predicted nucleic acid-binding protein
MRIAIIDSSCLICLVHLNLASQLVLYFDVIYVPRNVQIEINRKNRFRYRLNKLFATGVFRKCIGKDETSFRLLTAELDAGEAEGLVQAQEQGAEFFLVDERKAREIGVRQGLIPYGTVGLLARLCLEGYAEDMWALVAKLRKERAFRVGDEIVLRAIASAETPIGRFSEKADRP